MSFLVLFLLKSFFLFSVGEHEWGWGLCLDLHFVFASENVTIESILIFIAENFIK